MASAYKTISRIKREREELSIYNRIKLSAPDIPNITCPHIDSAILELENLRSMNDKLRDGYFFWKQECKKLSKELLALNKYIKNLEEES